MQLYSRIFLYLFTFLIFVIDYFIPTGYAIWLLYLFPLIITFWRFEKKMIYYITFTASFLILVGIGWESEGLLFIQSIFNRLIGLTIMWVIALSFIYHKEIENEFLENRDKLKESENRFKVLADYAPVLIWLKDPSKKCTFLNKVWLNFVGKTMSQEYGFGWTENLHPDDYEKVINTINDAYTKHEEFTIDYRLKRNDGEFRWVLDNGIPRYTPDGEFAGYIGSCVDITERKNSEEELSNSLKEKEVLLKEVHHRVKNNLQIIVSLLNLQMTSIGEKRLLSVLMESQNRVKSMALIHEKLYQSKDLSHVNFGEYVTELSSTLVSSYRVFVSDLKLHLELEPLVLSIDIAIPLGLILNEIITNSFKYAFPKDVDIKDKNLIIKLKEVDNEIFLNVSDNGVGLPKNLDIYNTNSLGFQLITSLSEQIHGKLEVKNKVGTEFKLLLKKD